MGPIQGRKKGCYYPELFRIRVVKEYLAGGVSQKSLSEKYEIDRSLISHWVRKFARNTKIQQMVKKPRKKSSVSLSADQIALERKVELLQRELREKEKEVERLNLQLFALDSLIDVAQEMFEIDIRKKPGAKQ